MTVSTTFSSSFSFLLEIDFIVWAEKIRAPDLKRACSNSVLSFEPYMCLNMSSRWLLISACAFFPRLLDIPSLWQLKSFTQTSVTVINIKTQSITRSVANEEHLKTLPSTSKMEGGKVLLADWYPTFCFISSAPKK